jgi:hypothetical protein
MTNNINWRHLTLELFVVFLGVTAGFILNNWRSNIHDIKYEQRYLQGFLQDIEANIETIEEQVLRDSLWLERSKLLLDSLEKSSLSLDSAEAVVGRITEYSKITTINGTWKDIINSGNLNLIRNLELKEEIVSYQVEIEGVEFIDDYLFQYYDTYNMPFLVEEFSILKGSLEDSNKIFGTRFTNIFAIYYSFVNQRFGAYKDLLQSSFNLQESLKQNLQE